MEDITLGELQVLQSKFGIDDFNSLLSNKLFLNKDNPNQALQLVKIESHDLENTFRTWST